MSSPEPAGFLPPSRVAKPCGRYDVCRTTHLPIDQPDSHPLTRRDRAAVTAACMMAMFMAAVEVTIVATAMPTIVADLGGAHLFTWVFAAYLLAQAVTTPIYGRLADIYGRKRVFFAGTLLFLASSMACGLTWSMASLVTFRTLQGLGAGCIQSISTTIVGDIYSPSERTRVQGWMSGVWALAALIGPALGAFIVQHLHWAYVFWINVPIGLSAIALLAVFLHETPKPRQHSIDYFGALLLMVGIGAIMTVVMQASQLTGLVAGALAAIGALALAWLFVHERRVPEPVISFALLRNPTVAMGTLGSLIIGALLMCVVAFVPTDVQAVMARTPTVAGIVVGSLSVAWSTSSIVAGRLLKTLPYRTVGIVGAIGLAVGAALLVLFDTPGQLIGLTSGALLVGVGMGFCNLVFLLLVQASVEWNQRGVATAAVLFARTLGQAVGAGFGGAVLNFGIVLRAPNASDALDQLLQPSLRAQLGSAHVEQLVAAVAAAVHDVYAMAGILALGALAAALRLPRHLRVRDHH
jgi:EmrB/QacA subfamily drug resistance transporter